MASEDNNNNNKMLSDLREKRGKAVVESDEHHRTDEGSTSKQPTPTKKRVDNPNSEFSSDSDDEMDLLEKVKEKLGSLYVGQEIDVIIEWMEEILNGLEDVRRELSTLKRTLASPIQVPEP